MDITKYDGNVHPDEWINDIRTYLDLWKLYDSSGRLNIAKSLVDSAIVLPIEVYDFGKLRNALKEDVSFTVFKNTNKRLLQSLKYITEKEGGKTSKFISDFRKLCYNAEIHDLEEQKKYLYKSLSMDCFNYIADEFYKRMKNVNSINELAKKFEDIVLEESNLIRNESIIALKHVATGKYLSSISNLRYTAGNKSQMVCLIHLFIYLIYLIYFIYFL